MFDPAATLTKYDTKAILAGVDLVDLIDKAINLKKIANSGELAGPCPKGCGHRVHVVPSPEGGYWWFCRSCYPHDNNKAHDAIAWVQWADNKTFSEACEALGGEKAPKTALQAPRLNPSPKSRPKVDALPPVAAPADVWQGRARAFVAWAQSNLWEKYPKALDYLVGRGLSLETIKAAGLGYNPESFTGKKARDPQEWGLDPAKYEGGVIIHRGWVIPCEAAGSLAYVKIRRPQGDIAAAKAWNKANPKAKYPKSEAKYLCISGSAKLGAIYGLDLLGGAFDLVICEGELSALSLRQELAGVAAVVSCGDAGNKPTAAALATMATVPRWYLTFDHDSAGDKGAAWWGEQSARFRPLPWPWGDRGEKYDCNDALQAGEDLAAWAIPRLGPSPEGTDKRRAWARYWLDKLFDVPTDESGPVARSFVAILGEYMALGPDYGPGDLAGDPLPVKQVDNRQEGGELAGVTVKQHGTARAAHLNGGELGGDPQGAGAFDSPVGEDLGGLDTLETLRGQRDG